MAVNLSALAVDLRVIAEATEEIPAGQAATLQRLLDYAVLEVEQTAPDAPQAAKDLAIVRLCGYVYESPSSPVGSGFADAIGNSGAQSLLCLLYTSPSPRDS